MDDDFGLFPAARRAFVERRGEVTALIDVDPAVGVTADHLDAVVEALAS
ncbi:hypothetical protein ACIQMJ_30715 [Actinosynnema sp. NPDC091369]